MPSILLAEPYFCDPALQLEFSSRLIKPTFIRSTRTKFYCEFRGSYSNESLFFVPFPVLEHIGAELCGMNKENRKKLRGE